MPTAFIYIRVSTPAQQVEEQVKCNNAYVEQNGITVLERYGDYGKRHNAHKRHSFRAMLDAIPIRKPDFILVQRLDRFGTADSNQLGYFLTILKQDNVRLITTIDGENRSKTDLQTVLMNAVAAAQSTFEQIDKAERVLTGKRGKAILGQYLGGKYLVYGCDLVCIGRDGQEKWRLVEDGWDLRIKYILDQNGDYVEAQRYGNEEVKDPNGIMPDKLVRFRPTKEKGEQLFYSPSIRQERVDTLRRMCEMFADGWTTCGIATQLNDEGNKPVHGDHWYSAVIDGLLENTVLIGKPTWNRTSQASFRRLAEDKIVPTEEDSKGVWQSQQPENWVQPDEEVFDPLVPPELFERVQARLEARKHATPKRSPRNQELWIAGLWVCGTTGQKLAGDASMKCFRVNHPAHQEKKLTFKEAERFIGQWLEIVGKRIEVLGEAAESKRLLKQLTTNEWLTELRFEYIRLEIENFLVAKLDEGHHEVGNAHVIIVWDNEEGCYSVDTNGDYLELYCEMMKDDMASGRKAVDDWMQERDGLKVELFRLVAQKKDAYTIEAMEERIAQLSKQIQEVANPPDYKRWWEEVQEEIATIRQQQEQVRVSIAKGEPLQKAQAIRQLIDHIVVEWATEPSKDRRHKGGVRTYCKGVRVIGTDGSETPIMTNETPLA
jgi:DNA invertase Pin-like site-specific DNA recombinase